MATPRLTLFISLHPFTSTMSRLSQTVSTGEEKGKGFPMEEVAPAEIAAEIAHEVENSEFSPWTASMFQLYGVLFVAYCCGCLNGYVIDTLQV